MKPEIKKLWVAKLRSGEYTQVAGNLRLADSHGCAFCCLGVLCDLYTKELGQEWSMALLEADDAALPRDNVSEWAGFEWTDDGFQNDPAVTINDVKARLSSHNDAGRSFAEIADAIEAQL